MAMVAIAGCGKRSRVAGSPAAADALPPPAILDAGIACGPGERAASTATRFACTRNADCVNNCKFGAVHWQWSEWLGPGCKDGCDGDRNAPPRCIDGQCVAFDDDQRDDHCTHRSAPDVICIPDITCPAGQKPQSTADRFDCAVDADCANNCQYGAINTWWDQRIGLGCEDGCANQITGPARCLSGRCVAFDDKNQRRDDCTNRAAPPFVCVTP